MNLTGLPGMSLDQLRDRIRDARVLERDPSPEGDFDAKVVVGADGLIFKFFRVRRFWSSNLVSPYARRFASNARRLVRAGVVAPGVRELFYVNDIRRQVAVYPWIEGVTLREKLKLGIGTGADREAFHRFGGFMAGLHQQGISFEGGHLNNYVATPGGGHALIDVTDVVFWRSALSRGARLRNLSKLARHPEDAALVRRLGWDPLLEGYREALKSLCGEACGLGIRPEEL